LSISNEAPLTVYDSSGPFTDRAATIDIAKGLDDVRGGWLQSRGEIEEYEGRTVTAADNGFATGERLTVDAIGAIIQLKNAMQADRTLLPVHVLLGKVLLANGEVPAAEAASASGRPRTQGCGPACR
jgi:hypothetical protein